MIPQTYPSVLDSGITKMVVYQLEDVDGLTAWVDYIPVKPKGDGPVNHYDGYIAVSSLESNSGLKAWIDYIPVYVDESATIPFSTNAGGYIPADIQDGELVALPPDGVMEDVIEPPVTSERSTYLFTKKGEVYALPDDAEPVGNGVYWPSCTIKMPSEDYPTRRFSFCSPDHGTGDSGIYLFVSVDDPTNSDNWKEYSDAVTAGWLDDFATKPSANPIYIGQNPGDDNQCETPRVVKVEDVWVMTYQLNDGIVGARNQGTVRAISTDGLNFVAPNQNTLLFVSSTDAIGDGHMGYFTWGENPFSEAINPATNEPWLYTGYSLIGGQTRSTCGMWGTDNPVDGTWTFISAVNKFSGRCVPDIPGTVGNWQTFSATNIDWTSLKVTRQGVSALCSGRVIGSGATATPSDHYEILLSNDGLSIIGQPIRVIARGGTGTIDNGAVDRGEVSIYGDKLVALYGAASSANWKVGAVAESPIRNPENTWFWPLTPAVPDVFDTKTIDFTSETSIPTGWTAVTAGTNPPTTSFSSSGLSVSVDGTLATPSKYLVFEDVGFDPLKTEYVDIYLEDWLTTSTNAYRIPYIGFAADKVVPASQTDAIMLHNGKSTAGTLSYEVLVASSNPLSTRASDYYYGVGFGATGLDGTAKSKKHLGIRYFPKVDKAYILGEGKGGNVELEELRTSSGNYVAEVDKSKRMYPFFGFVGSGSGTATERVGKVIVRVKEADSQSGDASFGTRTIAVSATNATSYTQNVELGTATAGRKVAIFVTGRSVTAPAGMSATITPNGQSTVSMTLVQRYGSTYDLPNVNTIALFVADVPLGSGTASFTVTISGATFVREGLAAFPLFDVDDKTPVHVATGQNTTGLKTRTYIDMPEGGITLAAVLYSSAGSTLISSAGQRNAVGYSQWQVSHLSTTTANGWDNIRGSEGGTSMEATGSLGNVIMAASWEKA
jgi:hypothetical protein